MTHRKLEKIVQDKMREKKIHKKQKGIIYTFYIK